MLLFENVFAFFCFEHLPLLGFFHRERGPTAEGARRSVLSGPSHLLALVSVELLHYQARVLMCLNANKRPSGFQWLNELRKKSNDSLHSQQENHSVTGPHLQMQPLCTLWRTITLVNWKIQYKRWRNFYWGWDSDCFSFVERQSKNSLTPNNSFQKEWKTLPNKQCFLEFHTDIRKLVVCGIIVWRIQYCYLCVLVWVSTRRLISDVASKSVVKNQKACEPNQRECPFYERCCMFIGS